MLELSLASLLAAVLEALRSFATKRLRDQQLFHFPTFRSPQPCQMMTPFPFCEPCGHLRCTTFRPRSALVANVWKLDFFFKLMLSLDTRTIPDKQLPRSTCSEC